MTASSVNGDNKAFAESGARRLVVGDGILVFTSRIRMESNLHVFRRRRTLSATTSSGTLCT
jgi:hypothetical protein